MLGHISDNNIIDSFQSAYMTGHSCTTVLLRVYYNDIVTNVGKGNGLCLGRLDLSTAFDAIYHYILLYILDLYVEIGCSALRRILSYFCDRTQRVQIE